MAHLDRLEYVPRLDRPAEVRKDEAVSAAA
jgi:hypothetical protein